HAITHYLFHESQAYLKGEDRFLKAKKQRKDELEQKEKAGTISERERKELIEVRRRLELTKVPTPLTKLIIDGEGNPVDELPPPSTKEELLEGRRLFRERGCLACHSHEGTAKADRDDRGPIPGVVSEANFGPDLTRLRDKLGLRPGDENARRWLIQWIM